MRRRGGNGSCCDRVSLKVAGKDPHMIKKLVSTLMAAMALSASAVIATSASAGEGHWSVGKGIQCKIVNGQVVCSKTRP